MQIEIPYGQEKIKIKTQEPCEILSPNKIKTSSEKQIIEKAFKSKSFEKFASDSKKLLVIVNDATRPTPTAKILDYLQPVLSKHPDVRFLVATGTHRAPTEQEMRFIFGKTYDGFKKQIFVHYSKKDENLHYYGKSKRGTEIYVNKMVPETGNVLVINSVEPHYFAGYTGGRKSFLPGVAGFKTIEMNHKFALSDKACTLALKDNPVNEDMNEMTSFLKNINIFSIQIVLTSDHKIYAITTGDLKETFDAAIKHANQVFCVPLKEKGNIVLTAAPYPMDLDLYQSQKALDNGKLALEDNGIIILVSKCRDGVGDPSFLDLLGRADNPKKILDILEHEYKFGAHKAAKIAEIGLRAEIWTVTDLDNSIIKKAQMKPYSNIQTALDDAIKTIKNRGKQPKIVVMPQGSLTVPYYC